MVLIKDNMFLLATLGAFGLGTVVSWPSNALLQIREEDEIQLSTAQESLVSSIAFIGAVLVQVVAGAVKQITFFFISDIFQHLHFLLLERNGH